MSAPFPNLYTHRKVAESSAKACDICYKPSTSVLITPDKKDFFYVCPIHLKDRYFCSPKIDEDAVKAKREKELADEVEKVKKEYEERQRRKKEKESKGKDKDKDDKDKDDKDKDKDSNDKAGGKEQDGPKDDKDDENRKQKEAKEAKEGAATPQEEEPRVFELKSPFYQQRLQRKRQVEAARRDRERASQPNYFPSVPTDLPGK